MAARRKLKWTEFVEIFGIKKKDTDNFTVCINRQGSKSSEELHALVAKCKETLGVTTLTWGSCYAGDCFELQWKEREYAYPLMGFLLQEGLGFRTQTHMPVYVKPDELKPGESCTPEWLDRNTALCLRQEIEKAAKEFFRGDLSKAIDMICGRNGFVNSHESSWLTEEGREFVRWAKSHYRFRDANSSDEEVTIPTPKRKREDDALDPSPSPPKKARPEEVQPVDEDDDVCMICLVNRPNTLVLPCMDRVVCTQCSPKLKATPDAHICVKCRRPITSVEEDTVV